MTDYYKILGIEITASQDEVKRAYRKLSIKFHPDKNNGDVFFENMFKQIQEAYEALESPNKRREYDTLFKAKQNEKTVNYNYSNFEPVIEFFYSDKILFYSGDQINFNWKTF